MYKQSFLKWAGSKQKVLPTLLPIIERYPHKIFVEPFVGAGNVTLNVKADTYVLSDNNYNLINCLAWAAELPEGLIAKARDLFAGGYESYYHIRDTFNTADDKDSVWFAAAFLYLNKFGFNGLCRYNKSGKFNVPVGKSKSIPKVSEELILNFADRLRHASLINTNFEETFEIAGAFDKNKELLIYCDPPYVPLTTDFNYTADGFGWEQQKELKRLALDSKHTTIISNHWTPLTEELYNDATELVVFDVQRTISSKGNDRKKVQEVIAIYEK